MGFFSVVKELFGIEDNSWTCASCGRNIPKMFTRLNRNGKKIDMFYISAVVFCSEGCWQRWIHGGN